MRHIATIATTVLSVLTTPVAAADFFCPPAQVLPATLNLPETPTAAQLKPVQTYLANLKAIRTAHAATRSRMAKDQLTNCLMDHLATLPDNASLQAPATYADGATWFLLRDEVLASLAMANQRHLKFKPQMPYIRRWLAYIPSYEHAPRTKRPKHQYYTRTIRYNSMAAN